jgi:excinuclease ABC subunit A
MVETCANAQNYNSARIDLGPEGGHAGDEVVATGTPEEIAPCKASHTGKFLKAHLRT